MNIVEKYPSYLLTVLLKSIKIHIDNYLYEMGDTVKKVDLTKGSVVRVLLALAIPIMGSSLLQFAYNIVDMFWVGGLGKDAVASVGSSSFFVGLGYAINACIVIGTGIKVAYSIGENKEIEAKEYIQTSMLLNLLIGGMYALFLVFVGPYLIGFLGIGDQVIEKQAYGYLLGSAPMLFFAFFNATFSRIFSNLGQTKSALQISIVGIVLNMILDPIFIYSFKWGVLGAALATLIAQMIMFFLYMKIGGKWFEFHWKKAFHSERIKAIVNLGWAVAFQRILFTLINILLAKLIAKFGPEAIAAQKIGLQIESVTYMVTGGLNGAVASFTGQNYGAHYYKRIKKGYQVAIGLSISYAVLTTTLFMIFAIPMANIFVKDATTIQMTSVYLQIIAYSQLFNAIEMVSNGWFTGIQKPQIPATISILFTALRLPMAWLLVIPLGLEGIWWSISISTLLKGSILYFCYKHYQGKLKEQEI